MARAKKVLLAVFDGLRPDMVTPDLMPHLAAFAAGGVWHREARSVFPSVTRVATSSIAAGAPPAVHGIVGNAFWMPDRLADRPIDTSKLADITRGGGGEAGAFHEAATFGDVVAAAGGRVKVVHTGSAGSAFLINPRAAKHGHWTFNIHGASQSATPDAVTDTVARFGPLPETSMPRFAWCDYATRVMTEAVIPSEDWQVAVVWFPEPDTSFHYLGISHPETLAMMRAVDAHFAELLAAIRARADGDEIAIIAASDHGQITVNREVPLFETLTSAGFAAGATLADDLVLLGVKGAQAELRLRHPDAALRDRVVAFLQDQPEVGQIFTRGRNEIEGEAPGTFALSLVAVDHARAPDILLTLRSDESPDDGGLPGLGLFMGGVPVGGGMHGGLNRHELNTMLAIGGAGLPSGRVVHEACGIIDIAPTILGLLGLKAPASMRGRDLTLFSEAPARESLATGHAGFEQSLDIAGGRYLQRGERLS